MRCRCSKSELANECELTSTQVIDAFFPSLIVDAQWSSHNYAALGNTLKPKKLQDAPSIRLTQPGASSGSCTPLADTTYTVAITDPDAPSREDPKWSEFCHWIATAVPVSRAYTASTCSHIELSGLQEVMPYKPPGPPEKTGKHRYVFLVFVPANGTAEPLSLTKPEDRQHWGYDYHGDRVGVRKWAAENGLVPVGESHVSSTFSVTDVILKENSAFLTFFFFFFSYSI